MVNRFANVLLECNTFRSASWFQVCEFARRGELAKSKVLAPSPST